MITLGNEQRDYGADSFIASGKFPETTFAELQRTFGEKFDSDAIDKFKEQRFITNNIAADERGYVAWKVSRAPYGDEESVQEILYSEEIVGMMFQYMKMLAEKQAGGFVRDVVITVPSWFTYDQRLMLKDAAEGLAGLNVLQLTHENIGAATMLAIDQKVENDEKQTVLFYNMGGMDTEVTIAEYSMVNVTEKKWSPHVHILAEANVRDLGSKDLDIIIVNLLAERFNALPERAGKADVRENVRAVKRLFKEALKIKETLSANKYANIKIPELLDYVTL